jgi:hypothetical protein
VITHLLQPTCVIPVCHFLMPRRCYRSSWSRRMGRTTLYSCAWSVAQSKKPSVTTVVYTCEEKWCPSS